MRVHGGARSCSHGGLPFVHGAASHLRLMAIDDGPLRGKWLYLVTPQEAQAMSTLNSGERGPPRSENAVEDNDVRIVALR